MDTRSLPYSKDEILNAADYLTEYLKEVEINDPERFERQQFQVVLNASQTLYSSLMLFFEIRPEDEETVADINANWQTAQDRITNNEASEADKQWMSHANRLMMDYRAEEPIFASFRKRLDESEK